ncbi:MAG: glycoside hydrolase family 88 protein [Eubacteriales bacterium]|nr:glycoside hydrolase family 88 protein [Eubacteriales bacterium]MDD3881308.1 glycoside hydrolase family 88 protein [Eubacteriales bacterium]MDD4512226.1 glycoside hydrolase family 88 protein [Eubacteriales bacterium]
MEEYFDSRQSAAYTCGYDAETIVRLMAERYIGENPETPYVYRAYDESGIGCDRKAGYILDFDRRFPQSENGSASYAAGELYSAESRKTAFLISCASPTAVWFRGEKAFSSFGATERDGTPARFEVQLKKGFNRFVIRCEKAGIGFGCRLQNAMPQWEPCNFLMPFQERGGEAGFLWTRPRREQADIDSLFKQSEAESGLEWLPKAEAEMQQDDGLYYGWSKLRLSGAKKLELDIPKGLSVRIDGKAAGGELSSGSHQLLLFGKPSDIAALRVSAEGASMEAPVKIHGRTTSFLLLGPLNKEIDRFAPDIAQVAEGHSWKTGYKGIAVRPYAEARLFGRWTYPLGVTLYGMLRAGRLFDMPELSAYVSRHIHAVTEIQRYAKHDTEKYGFAGVNQQFCWLDALDDCGSFASLLLEYDKEGKNEKIREIANETADYMLFHQPRTAEGAFVRRDDTIWADDMYMSVPFLSRYAGYSGCKAAMKECVKQLLLYKKLLFMKDKGVMAHMRCERRGKNNGIPWSRGNGWVIFSLSELLERLPEDADERNDLISFFCELTRGYLRLQGENGMWRQVLDEPETYSEASSTAMMICAFSRGVMNGWYEKELCEKAGNAARRAWKGLCETAIDSGGNLYGVCRGSGFSFSRDYYKTLSWNFNDTHGIGIVMLAATELKRLEASGIQHCTAAADH